MEELDLSLSLYLSMSVSESTLATESRNVLHASGLSHAEDEPREVNAQERQFRQTFEMTDDDVSRAIKPDEQAAARLNELGNSCLQRFEHSGDVDDISEAIKNLQRAVQLTPDGHADLPTRLNNLGFSLSCRFDHNGDLEDISKAIENQQRAVRLNPDGHANLPTLLNNLGLSLSRRFLHIGDLGDISEAIENQQQAVRVAPDGHANLPIMLINLGASFSCRYECHGRQEDICEAIKHQQRAVQLTPNGRANLPTWLSNLGFSLSRRFDHNGELDVSEAIENHRRAVRLTTDRHADLPTRLNNLGLSLANRFLHIGNLEDISEAIENQQHAVRLTQDGHANLPTWLNHLGRSLSHRFEHIGDLEDISEAIKNQRRAVQLTSDEHAGLPSRLNNLGLSLSYRFQHVGDLEDIFEAIQNQRRAVRLTPDGHADLPTLLHNLGCSLSRRFEHIGDLKDISEAIKNLQRAVQLTPDGHANRPTRLSNLGLSLSRRFEHIRDLEDISEAIENQLHAVRLTPDGHADLPTRLSNLGVFLSHRFEHIRDLDDISEAIQHQQRAVRLISDGHPDLPTELDNLGFSLSRRFEHTGNLEDMREAIKNYQHAVRFTPDGHASLTTKLNHLGASFSRHFERNGDPEFHANAISTYCLSATCAAGPPLIRLRAALRWVSHLQRSRSTSLQLLEAHACIIQLVCLVSGLGLTVQRRHQTLVNSSPLSLVASAAALSLGRLDKALEWLVEGRCIIWNQIHQLRTPLDQLRAHNRDLADRLSAVSRELEHVGSRSEIRDKELSTDDKISLEGQAGRHIKLAKERDQLLSSIRDIAGFEDFLQPRKCADIMGRLPTGGTIVIINIHQQRCDALALMAGAVDPLHIPLPEFSYGEAERLAKGLREQILHPSRKGSPLDTDDLPSDVTLVEVLSVLWSRVVWPILDALSFPICDGESTSSANVPRIWWCPTGPLAPLPIHAAGNYRSADTPKLCLSDFAVSSYIPTVNFLEQSEPDSLKKPAAASTGLLIVSQPNTPRMQPIPGAAHEAKKISTHLESRRIHSSTLRDQRGTVKTVSKAMEGFPSIHLACHASQNETNPLKSSIHLHDGPLELSEIMKKNLPHADFAFLSACQTSTADKKLPDEVVHLAAGMLAAGYRSVVGTMWSISDKHGPDMADFFYESLVDSATNEEPKIHGARAARALHRATQRFREKISDELVIWVPYIHIGV